MDIESYPNVFLVGFKDIDTQQGQVLEISEYKNDIDQVYRIFDNYKNFMITFNGIHYDQPVLAYICIHYEYLKKLSNLDIAKKINEFSNYVIHTDFIDNKYKYYFNWTPIDLYLYWSKDLRISKKISLKGLGIQMNYEVVQELPYKVGTYLNQEQIKNLKHYNYVHDLGILEKLIDHPIKWQGKPTTFRKQIQLRGAIHQEFNLNKFIYSWDAPKIASELLLNSYSKIKNKPSWELKKEEEGYIEQTRLPLQNPNFKLSQFQQLYSEMCVATRDFSKEIIFNYNNTSIKISYGIGGIHSVNNNEIYETNEQQKKKKIYTSDVSSLYPNLIINYKAIRQQEVLERYIQIKEERIEAKKNKEKNKDATLKLVLNSTSGLLDNQYSWLYYPEGAMQIRLMGQLIMTKVVEELAIADFKIISINTDGIECIVPIDKEKQYLEIIQEIGIQFNVEFEHDIYKKIVYSNVNNYVAINFEGEIKQKGRTFITEPNIGDSCNYLIIPKALIEYFINGIDVEEYIKRSDHSIFDFCISMKSDKKYTVYWNNEIQQRLNRFYVANEGKFLYKSQDGIKMNNMLKGWGVQLYNVHEKKPIQEYNINYSFYISEAKKWINQIQNNNQLKLF